MGRFGFTEILIVVAVLGLVIWVRHVMNKGKARFEAERRAREAARPVAQPAVVTANVVEREKVIERQVVVTRCGFCKKLTPVDLTACENCGARL